MDLSLAELAAEIRVNMTMLIVLVLALYAAILSTLTFCSKSRRAADSETWVPDAFPKQSGPTKTIAILTVKGPLLPEVAAAIREQIEKGLAEGRNAFVLEQGMQLDFCSVPLHSMVARFFE